MNTSKSASFRRLLEMKKPIVAVGAHNAISAILAEQAGFDVIWSSGFEISATFGIPDANILTMSENLYIARMINDKVSLPVIADCDNGYGNVINVIRLVEEYEKIGIAGICIEDNVFPKRHSFWPGVKRNLESIEEFAGKIKAAKENRKSEAFVIIARTEAFIAELGLNETLARALAYEKAGADMIVVHSKLNKPTEMFEFTKHWKGKVPLIAIPSVYKNTSVETLYEHGYKMVIFANATLRASVFGMRKALKILRKKEKLAGVSNIIVSLKDIYQLTKVGKMYDNENKYLSKRKI